LIQRKLRSLLELSFEQGLKLLEELVDKVESGELSLENSIEAYEKGTFIIERLRAELFKAEKKLKILDKDSDEKS